MSNYRFNIEYRGISKKGFEVTLSGGFNSKEDLKTTISTLEKGIGELGISPMISEQETDYRWFQVSRIFIDKNDNNELQSYDLYQPISQYIWYHLKELRKIKLKSIKK